MGHGDGRQRAGRTRTKDVDVPDARAAQSGRTLLRKSKTRLFRCAPITWNLTNGPASFWAVSTLHRPI